MANLLRSAKGFLQLAAFAAHNNNHARVALHEIQWPRLSSSFSILARLRIYYRRCSRSRPHVYSCLAYGLSHGGHADGRHHAYRHGADSLGFVSRRLWLDAAPDVAAPG